MGDGNFVPAGVIVYFIFLIVEFFGACGQGEAETMPTYEYECTHCEHVFERFQSITAPPLKRCPKCRHRIRRLIGTGVGVIFKGNGFYQTDYRSPEYTRKAQAEQKSADSGGEKKPAATTEKTAKPAATTEKTTKASNAAS